MTLSGVSKADRRERAKKALEQVGLGDQLRKKPSEMSGGQMQRVAIARALVNNPDIILADEPTGALDTETSVQVMEILKEISKDRLIIMVTHNPDLAERYSSRIVRMLDGRVTDDSQPLDGEELKKETEADKKEQDGTKKVKKPTMSFGTSFMLSLKNLISKKGRTTLTAFAGSIGIIGIALILAISQGMTTYIDTVQEETLSTYPLTIERTTTDISALMETFMGLTKSEVSHDKDSVYKKSALYDMIDAMNNLETTENDLCEFKKYVEEQRSDKDSRLYSALQGVQYSYDLNLLIYTKNVDGDIIRSDTESLLSDVMKEYMGMDMSAMTNAASSMPGMDAMPGGGSMPAPGGNGMPMPGGSSLWQEMLPGRDGQPVSEVLKNQYDMVYGEWPKNYNEVVLVLDENNELDDLALYALGLESKETVDNIMKAALEGEELEKREKSWTYREICDRDYRVVLNSERYNYNEDTGLFEDRSATEIGLKYLYDNGLTLKVTGIIRPGEDATATMLSGSIGYTSALTDYIIEQAKGSEAIEAQLADSATDVFTGLPFKATTDSLSDSEKETAFHDYISVLGEAKKAEIYLKIMGIPTQDVLDGAVDQAMSGMGRKDMEGAFIQAMQEQMHMSESDALAYVGNMTDEELTGLFVQMVTEQAKEQYAAQVREQMSGMKPAELAAALDETAEKITAAQCVLYYDEVLEFSETTYEDNLKTLGYIDLDDPSAINLYAASFADKDAIADMIDEYNSGRDKLSRLKFTDYVGLMMSSITSIINAITYVLIAFVAISLIVSSIMIGVITLISVQERTKEIGILRAIGASKRNVSSMFNAETVIIGFVSGLLGIVVTVLLCIPINTVIHNLTGIGSLSAFLRPDYAAILILISVALTLVSGLIPSRSAAKKAPVVALRSE